MHTDKCDMIRKGEEAKMKRIINWFLALGAIVSAGVALKFSALPVLSLLPDSWTELWVSSAEEQQRYVLLYDIAVGFIMSALFYFIVEEIPDKVRMHKAKHLIKNQINQLLRDMEQIISITIGKYNLNQSLKELTQKDFLILDGETQHPAEEVSYLTTIYFVKGKKRKTAFHQYGDINQLVKNNLKNILNDISIIKNYEYFYAGDSRLVECIRKIEGCNLIRYYFDDGKKKDTPCFRLHGTSTAMIDFVALYLQLLKRKFHTEYTVTTLDSEEETEKYRKDRESGVLFQHVIDLQTKRKNTALTNPTVVISGSKYTTNIIVSQLKRRLAAVYISIDDVEIEKLNVFKYVVFIIDSSTRDTITHILNTNEITSRILLLTERTVLKKHVKSKNRHNNIIGELFFRVAFDICGFPLILYKQEPSEKAIADIEHKIEALLYGEN